MTNKAGLDAAMNLAASLENKVHALEKQNEQLLATLDVFFKVVVVDGKQYRPGYPLCAGCPHLTVARGMECYYKRQTTECKYPDTLKEQALADAKAGKCD